MIDTKLHAAQQNRRMIPWLRRRALLEVVINCLFHKQSAWPYSHVVAKIMRRHIRFAKVYQISII
jgi:hypothetical protein